MSEDLSSDEPSADAVEIDPPAPHRHRQPRWLWFAPLTLLPLVAALIGLTVILLQESGPHAVVLHGGAATPIALLDSPPSAPSDAVITPSAEPLGVLEKGAPIVGKPVPDFALLDLKGRRVQLSTFRGKAVVINFWATWCGPCRQEFPELQKATATLGDQVVVLALDQAESGSKVSQFRDEFGASFTILLDSHADVADGYRLSGIPDTIFVDGNGIVRDVAFGPLSAGTFRYKMNHLLSQQ